MTEQRIAWDRRVGSGKVNRRADLSYQALPRSVCL